MIDESADIKPVPDAGRRAVSSDAEALAPAKKKRARTSAKAIMAAIETAVGAHSSPISRC